MASTYIGGSYNSELNAIALDTSENAFVAGSTLDTDIPATPNAHQATCKSLGLQPTQPCAFFAELLAPDYTKMPLLTLHGGSDGGTRANGIAVDKLGSVYMTGATTASDLPVTPSAVQATYAGNGDAFVVKFDKTGALVYSTFLGGSGTESGQAIAVDSHGNAFVTGGTNTDNANAANKFPITAGVIQPNYGGGSMNCQTSSIACGDAFITGINATGSALLFSTYFGGSGDDLGTSIGLDPEGHIHLAGATNSADLAVTPNAFQTKFAGGTLAEKCAAGTFCGDAFVAILSATANRPLMSTYLGGSGDDAGTAVAVSPKDGAVVAAGVTASPTFPTVHSSTGAAPLQSTLGGISNGFLTQFAPVGPPPCTMFWIGLQTAPPANWNTPSLWSSVAPPAPPITGALPGATDKACLNGAKLFVDSTLPPANQSIGDIDSQTVGSLEIQSGATLSIGILGPNCVAQTGPGRLHDFILSGGTFVVNEGIGGTGSFTFDGGTVNTSDSLSFSGVTTSTGGTIKGANNGCSGVIASGGFNLTGTLTVDTVGLLIGGASKMSGPSTLIGLTKGAIFSNSQTSGTLDLMDSDGIVSDAQPGSASVINFGTVLKSTANTITTIDATFENDNVLDVKNGSLILQAGATTSGGGTINVEAPAGLQLEGTIVLAPHNIIGAGTIIWRPSPNAFIAAGFDQSGTNVQPTYNFSGESDFTSGGTFFTDATVTNLGSALIDNATVTFGGTEALGTTVMVSDSIGMGPGGVLTNQTNSTLAFSNDSGITVIGGGTPIFNNFGTLLKSGGTASPGTVIGSIFNHAGGLFNIKAGSVTLQGGGIISAEVELTSGDNLNFETGKFTVSGILSGPLLLGGGFFDIAPAATVDLQTGATLKDSTIINSGAVTLSGNFTMGSNSVPPEFNNQAGASFTINNDSSINATGPFPPVFNNLGQFTKAGGALTPGSSIAPDFNHKGGGVNVNLGAGTVSFTGGGTFNAPATVAAGGKLAFGAGTYTLTSTLNGPGTFEIGGATVNFNAGAAMPAGGNAPILNLLNPGVANLAGVALNPDTFKFSGGNLNGPGTVNVPTLLSWSGGVMAGGGTLNLAAASTSLLQNNLTDNGWNINNSGSVTMSGPGNSMTANGNAVLANLAAATWDFGDYTNVGSAPANLSTFNNFGTLKKSLAGPGMLTLSSLFDNKPGASFLINGGAVNLLGTNNCPPVNPAVGCAGAYALANGTQLLFGDANFLTSGAIAAAGGTVTVQGAGPGASPILDLLGGAINIGTVALGTAGKIIVEKPVIATMNNVNITGGGVLTGQGTITGNVTNTNGSVQPGPQGAGVGTLTVTGNFTQAVGGTLQENIAGQGLTAGGVNYDQLVVTGTASLTGTMTGILAAPYVPPVPKLGDQVKLIATPGASGFFSTNSIQAPPGMLWTIANTPTGVVATLATAVPLTSIAVTPNPASTAAGTTLQFTATGTFQDNSKQDVTNSVTWSTTDTTIATINTTGLATGVKAGGPITVMAVSGAITGTAQLTVTSAPLASIAVTPNPASTAAGTTLQFTATGTFSDNSKQDLTNSVTWSSSDTTIATINTTGLATSVKAGGPITVKAVSGAISGTAPLTVTAATLASIAVTPNPASTAAGTTLQFTATGTFSDNSKQDLTNSVTWSSSDTTIAAITGTGLASGVKAGGPVTIKALQGAISGTAPLTVTAGAPAMITATAGSGQSTPISTAFAAAFQATVKDGSNTPAPGVTVTFTAPANGPSGTFANGANTAVTNASGVATSAIFTANSTAGGPYNVSATTGALAPATFSLTNVDFLITQDASTAGTIQITAGTPQTIKIDVTNIPATAPLPQTITFACTPPLPAGTTCTFNQPTIPAGSPSGSSTLLSIHTTSSTGVMGLSLPTSIKRGPRAPYLLCLAVVTLLATISIFAAPPHRSRRLPAYLTLVVLAIVAAGISSCTSAGYGSGPTYTPTPLGGSSFTVTATSGADAHPILIKINVQ